jgi:hypothetical protein
MAKNSFGRISKMRLVPDCKMLCCREFNARQRSVSQWVEDRSGMDQTCDLLVAEYDPTVVVYALVGHRPSDKVRYSSKQTIVNVHADINNDVSKFLIRQQFGQYLL